MAKKSFDIDRLRALRAELGTKEVARRMGIPQPSLRRILSTKKLSPRMVQRATVAPDIYDLADAMGVDAEDLAEDLGIDLENDFWDAFDPNEDADVFDDLADILDMDVSDIYDMYYGYPPGSHGR